VIYSLGEETVVVVTYKYLTGGVVVVLFYSFFYAAKILHLKYRIMYCGSCNLIL